MLPSDPHKEMVDDLFEEARHWLDGSEITNEAEAEGVDRLLDLAREAKKAADEARKLENEPFDTGKAEVQGRYNPILNRAQSIVDGCRDVLTPWRNKLAAQKRAEAEKVRIAAEEAQSKAEAAQVAARGNAGAKEIANTALEDARRLSKTAAKLERNADKSTGLRTSHNVEIVDLKIAIGHYYRTRQQIMADFIQGLAEADARKGVPVIPGITITERKGAI
jgi:hypothetical protein